MKSNFAVVPKKEISQIETEYDDLPLLEECDSEETELVVNRKPFFYGNDHTEESIMSLVLTNREPKQEIIKLY